MSSTESRYSLPSPVVISVPSPYHRRLIPRAANLRPTRSGARHPPLPRPCCPLAFFLPPGARPPPALRPRRVFPAARPPGVLDTRGHLGPPPLAPVTPNHPPPLSFHPPPPGPPRRGIPVPPLVKP